MKKIPLYIIIVILSACGIKSADKKLQMIALLPNFIIQSLDSLRIIDTKDIPYGRPNVFIYFSPECEHCQRMTTLLLANDHAFSNLHIYMLTNESTESTMKFVKSFHTDSLQNVFVGKDVRYSFYNIFLPPELPFIAIYDSQKRLKKIYLGETDINSIIKNIKE